MQEGQSYQKGLFYNIHCLLFFLDVILAAKVVSSFRKRKRSSTIIKSIMHRRFSFQRKQNSALRKLFKKIDSDSNGFISRSELRQYLEECCFFRDKEDATNSILENCDVNQDGYIDFDEFRHIIHTVEKQREDPPSNEELQNVFELFDADGNHLISFKEFWRQVRTLDASIAKKEAEAMFNDIDQDSDGYIDFGEFIRYLNFPN